MKQSTPMMRQYYDIKSQHPDSIVFFRLGDFYEMFDDDAVKAARLLDITLTSREAGRGQRIPMCGVPHHAAAGYIHSLIEQGHKVAVCEQVEDPQTAKGVVRREVVRLITPGTILDGELLDARENNYLAAVRRSGEQRPVFGLAFCDPSTGEFSCTEIEGEHAVEVLKDELLRIRPAEILLDPTFSEPSNQSLTTRLTAGLDSSVETAASSSFDPSAGRRRLLTHFGTESLEGFGCESLRQAQGAAGAVLVYLEEAHKTALKQVTKLVTYAPHGHMLLDGATRRNLELVRTLRGGGRKGSLLWLLDQTKTAMGSRLLHRWIMQPLVDAGAIDRRLAAVEELVGQSDLRMHLQQLLDRMSDIERLVGRVAYGSANGRDLRALHESLAAVPSIKDNLSAHCRTDLLRELADAIDPCTALADFIDRSLKDDPPVSTTVGGLIRQGYSSQVDALRSARDGGKAWIADLEKTERERTGIKSLKVGFNKVFGYYIEVTKPNLSLVPEGYERRQTLANAERFITPELKEQESLVLGAEDRVIQLETELFLEVRSHVETWTARLQSLAAAVAQVDVLVSLAHVAVTRRYVRPAVDHGDVIQIGAGRHPIVEAIGDEEFVPNDLRLDEETQIMLLTGPNMAGKSTFLRQTALIVLMGQIGSFVPASSAHIGVVDRIFTRVGASDDLATGQSTFMVEMNEVAHILNHATAKSLVILDEVGRGTSTFDGLSIAWAVTEHMHGPGPAGPKTLFATHYHELTQLETSLPRLRNYTVAVHKREAGIVFLRRIISGGADQSYGIEVARLAGLPGSIIQRAQALLSDLEKGQARPAIDESAAAADEDGDRPHLDRRSAGLQVPLFTDIDPVALRLLSIDINTLTPLEALNLLSEMQDEIRSQRGNVGERFHSRPN